MNNILKIVSILKINISKTRGTVKVLIIRRLLTDIVHKRTISVFLVWNIVGVGDSYKK